MANSQTGQRSNNGAFRSVPFGLWLSWQELNGRKIVFSINVIIVALLIALPVSLDLVGKARESSIETRIDYIGPSLILVPGGVLSSDLVTAEFKGNTFSSSTFDTIEQEFSRYLRGSEARLTRRLLVDNRDMPVVGINFTNVYSYPFSQYKVSDREVLLGSVASEKLRKSKGDIVRIRFQTFTVIGIIPTTGGIDDASIFLPLNVLQRLAGQEGHINEIRLFPESASSLFELKSHLEKQTNELNIIDAYRGDTAEKDIDITLLTYQKALYTVAFILIALCIMISTYINLDARKSEVSTIYTLGAREGIIFQLLTLRTVWITLLGSFIGQFIALIIATLQDYQIPLRFIWSGGSFILILLGTVSLGMIVTVPFAFYSVYRRDYISDL